MDGDFLLQLLQSDFREIRTASPVASHQGWEIPVSTYFLMFFLNKWMFFVWDICILNKHFFAMIVPLPEIVHQCCGSTTTQLNTSNSANQHLSLQHATTWQSDQVGKSGWWQSDKSEDGVWDSTDDPTTVRWLTGEINNNNPKRKDIEKRGNRERRRDERLASCKAQQWGN